MLLPAAGALRRQGAPSSTASYRAPTASTSIGCCAWPTPCGTELGLEPRRPLRGHGPEQPPVPRAVPRRFLGAGVVNPLNLRLARKELDFILRDSGTERRLRRRRVRGASVDDGRQATRADSSRSCSSARATSPTTSATRTCSAPGEPVVPDEPDEDDPVDPHVHGRHDRACPRACCSISGPRCSTCYHDRHPLAARRAPRLPAPDADVPRRVDGRRARHPGASAAPRSSCRCSTRRPCWTRSSATASPSTVMVPTMIAHAARPPRLRARAARDPRGAHLRRLAHADRAARAAARAVPRTSTCTRATA